MYEIFRSFIFIHHKIIVDQRLVFAVRTVILGINFTDMVHIGNAKLAQRLIIQFIDRLIEVHFFKCRAVQIFIIFHCGGHRAV